MRLVSNDTYSFGDGTFAWFGLIDPKLFQRYTWLLSIPIFTPVTIGIKGVGSSTIPSGITALSQKVSVGSPKIGVSVRDC
jgi:hypothetical protein